LIDVEVKVFLDHMVASASTRASMKKLSSQLKLTSLGKCSLPRPE